MAAPKNLFIFFLIHSKIKEEENEKKNKNCNKILNNKQQKPNQVGTNKKKKTDLQRIFQC